MVSRGGGIPSATVFLLLLLLTVPGSYLLQQVSLLNGLKHTLLGGVLDIPTHQKLIQDKVGFLKVEDDVQLTYLGEGEKAELSIKVYPSLLPSALGP